MAFARNLIPYRQSDVSPFERPLSDTELEKFAGELSDYRSRAFALPYISLLEIIPFFRKYQKLLYHLDGKLLQRIPALWFYATIRVIDDD